MFATNDAGRRHALTAGAVAVYVVAFFALKPIAGAGAEAAVALPVITAGALWGVRAGIVAALLGFLANLGLVAFGSPDGFVAFIDDGGALRHILVLIIGGTAGQLNELGQRLERQKAERRAAEAALRQEVADRLALAQIGRVVSSSLDLEEVYRGLCESLRAVISFDGIAVASVQPESRRMAFAYAEGPATPPAARNASAPLEGAWAESVVKAGCAVSFDLGPAQTPQPGARASDDVGWPAEAASLMAVPLASKNSVFGVLAVASERQRAFSPRDLAMMDRVAAQISDSIANARLHAELEREAEERSALAEIMRVVTAADSPCRMYEELNEVLKFLLQFDRLEIATFDETRGLLETVFAWGETVPGFDPGATVSGIADGSEWCDLWQGSASTPPGSCPNPAAAAAYAESRLASWVIVPLRARERLIGTLTIGRLSTEGYAARDLDLIERIAVHIAPIMDNALALQIERALFERLEKQNWDLLEARAQLEAAAEGLRSQNEALQASNEAKTRFLSMVSHELNTPLTIITGFAELMAGNPAGNLLPEQVQYLKVMLRNGRQLSGLVDELLDVARLESGRFGLQLSEFDAIEMVEEVLQGFSPIIAQKNQHLAARLPVGPVWLRADRARLGQVITNLVSNASKYSDEGSRIELRGRVGESRFTIEVADRGIGISEEDRKRLFTSFFRSSAHSAQNISGTGLGLVIARSIVELHGGEIEVESEPGVGTTFRFYVPAIINRPSDRALARSGARSGASTCEPAMTDEGAR